jgi:transcriptional regulator with XRE-family HTH domain
MALDLFGSTGKRIKALRTSRDINQKELVAALKKQGVDVGPSFISQVESNRKQPPLELLVGLAKVLGTTTDYLLMVTNDPTPNAATDSQLIIDVQDRSDRALLEEWVEVMQDISPERRESILRSVRLLLSPPDQKPPRIIE